MAEPPAPILGELLALRAAGGPLVALEPADLERLVAELAELRLAPGETLLRAGEPAEEVFLVLAGELEVVTPGGGARLGRIGPGELVGEVALVVGGARTADVRAAPGGAARLARLSRAGFDQLVARSPETGRHVLELVLARLRRAELLPHLDRHLGPFGEAEAPILAELQASVGHVSLARGATLFRQGEEADAAYVVLTGALRVVRNEAGAERTLHEAGRGELLGEMALLTDDVRSATVWAVRDSELARIPRSSFVRLLGRRPASALRVAHAVIGRLQRPAAAGTRAGGCVALAAAAPGVPLAELAEALARELERAAPGGVALLTSGAVDDALGRAGIAQAEPGSPAALRLASWLHEQEHRHRWVLYRADPDRGRWSERCLGQAEHVVTVADAADPPGLGPLESAPEEGGARARRPRRTLLLLHPAGLDQPRGTARRLAVRDVDEVLHLRRGDAGDLARVARILSGRAVGLVLGGGGARGFAHLGVVRALEELGVPVDLVGGASIGAPVGFPTARGLDAAAALALVEREFRSLLDYTLPIASLIAGRRITRAIERQAGDLDIEDLLLPYFCVSTDLTKAESRVHRRGPLARAMRASVSIPGVLPPVPMDGSLLVDGGVLDNVPVGVMRARNPHGTVIAIDVSPPRGPAARSDYGLSVSGWGLALGRLVPGRRSPVPALGAIILQSQIVAANRSRQAMLDAGLADFYRNVHVRGVGMLDFGDPARVARIGYEDALGPLREWVAAGGLSRS